MISMEKNVNMKEVHQEYKHAVSIGSVTLVGIIGTPPFSRGNCFTVGLKEGGWCKIVNFNYENFTYLKSEKIIEFPIKVLILSDRVGVFCDSSIPEDYYQTEFCTVCTPAKLLPTTQRIKQLIEIQEGFRKEFDNGVVSYTPKNYKASVLKTDVKVGPPQEGFVYAPYPPAVHSCDEVLCTDGSKCRKE